MKKGAVLVVVLVVLPQACAFPTHAALMRGGDLFLQEASDSFEEELNDEVSEDEGNGVVVHKHHRHTQVLLGADPYKGNSDKYSKKQPSGSTRAKDKANNQKKKNGDPSIEPKQRSGFEPNDPIDGDSQRSPDNDRYTVRFAGAPFLNRNNYTGRFEGHHWIERPKNVRSGGPMEGEGYDLMNKLLVDEPDLNSPPGDSYFVPATVRTAPGRMGPVAEEEEEGPPRATDVAGVAHDKPKPQPQVQPEIEVPKPVYKAIPEVPVPPVDLVPPDLVKSKYLNQDFMDEALPEFQLPEGCNAQNYKDCMQSFFLDLEARTSATVGTKAQLRGGNPCLDGGKDAGAECAEYDFEKGKIQGFASGYAFGANQLLKAFLNAYRIGYTEAYDAAFVEGQDKFISDKATGQTDNAFADEAADMVAGLKDSRDKDGSKPKLNAADASDPDGVTVAAKDAEQKAAQKQEEEDKENLKQDPEGETTKRKQAACQEEKETEKAEEENDPNLATGGLTTGPKRNLDEQREEDNKECDTSAGVTLEG